MAASFQIILPKYGVQCWADSTLSSYLELKVARNAAADRARERCTGIGSSSAESALMCIVTNGLRRLPQSEAAEVVHAGLGSSLRWRCCRDSDTLLEA
jgi:hypothetical protein